MKKNTISLFLILFALGVQAQNGLENIIVEKYYISDANDASANPDGGVLPVGSITYRIFVDLLPGYEFQAAYGSPSHELRIATTTLFFNNEDRGSTAPTNITRTHASQNTVMLDSWLSAGAACSGNYGILKTNDDGLTNVVNTYSPQVLQNSNPLAGIPLTTQDGLITGASAPEAVQMIGLDNLVTVFDNQNDGTNGPLFSVSNGSWYSFNGSYGPDLAINQVLIAQITTNGIFSFELNIQVGTPGGGVQRFVARNPAVNEYSIPSLVYNSTVTDVPQLNNISSVPTFNVYPNPASDMVTLEIHPAKENSKNSYVVYNEMGSLVLSKVLSSFGTAFLEHLDISSLASGMYFIQLTSGDATSSKKIFKH